MEELVQTQNTLAEDAAALEAVSLRLSWVMRRRLEQELAHFQLTMPQYMALRCVERSGGTGCSMTDLAAASHQVLPTMTGIVDRLAERGLVVRERDPRDRRALLVRMTDAGESLMEQVTERKLALSSRVLSRLSPEERGVVIGVLERYLAVFQSGLDGQDEAANTGMQE